MKKFAIPGILAFAIVGTGIIVPVLKSQDDVQINLDYPESYEIGELVTIRANSNADSLIWKIIPENLNFQIVNNEILFSSTEPIDYTIIVAGNKGDKIDCKIFTLKYGKGKIKPKTTFQTKVKSWLPPNHDKEIAKNLALSFKTVAKVMEKSNIDDLIMATTWATKEALGPHFDDWRSFLINFQEYLENDPPETLEEHIQLWNELALILEQ